MRIYVLGSAALLAIYLAVRGGGNKKVEEVYPCITNTDFNPNDVQNQTDNELKYWLNPYKIRMTLTKGCKNMSVAILQQHLRNKGLSQPLTGLFDSTTEANLRTAYNVAEIRLQDTTIPKP